MKNIKRELNIKTGVCPHCIALGVTHKSDCAVHNMPAYPNGECNCGAKNNHEEN